MSQENVDVVRRYIEAFNQGDFAAAMAAYADDVVLVVDEGVVPTNAGTFAGRAEVGDWFRRLVSVLCPGLSPPDRRGALG